MVSRTAKETDAEARFHGAVETHAPVRERMKYFLCWPHVALFGRRWEDCCRLKYNMENAFPKKFKLNRLA